ncbi:Hsp70 family protein [Alkanindiges illinoisensis]|uniref:Hsp70 family protein n=1 Tax=Alkanindiges illinoisensis TaxID=197183 RepID=A0A4Y7XGL2_9GAMM|nr:Hsp70 family protein [Alkanindiges illinoisensis]TEU30862.1 Hsp70 family protein [Alkanindiges illinoisensis]
MRQKIDYGIDLGTTNSAIARMDSGEAVIIKSDDNQMDTTPSCVSFNKKQTMFVGLSAKSAIEREAVAAFKARKANAANGYLEFKRTMGTDHQYTSSNMNRSYNSEELSAEVLKKLKGYVRDEEIVSAVITVPAMFKQSQLEATQRAAELAGFGYCELLQEPIAASIAYGIKANAATGYWLVFDFGGGTFDAALMHVDEGIMKVVDTAGDNHLGGKDLDNVIVDQLFIPALRKQCALDDTLSNPQTKKLLQEALKSYAEQAKITLSSKSQWNYFLEDLGEDDDGEEIQAELSISLDEYERATRPVFQKAVDIAKNILTRNKLAGLDLSSLILVGGPTFSQTLRQMLREQVTANVDTSIDPMTAVARGAALFASTKNIPDNLQKRDSSKAQLSLKYPETTVETHENLGIRIDRSKSTANLPEKFSLEVLRGDSAWSSGKITMDSDVEIVEIQLNAGKPNQFTIKLAGLDGSSIPCEPSSITIIHGLKIASATLPYAIGLEVYDTTDAKQGVYPLEGLEKNKTLPAKGKGRFKTAQDIRPGNASDKLFIPLYEFESEGSRAVLNSFFGKFSITGKDLGAFLPINSDIEVTLRIDASRRGSLSVYIPALDETFDIVIDHENTEAEANDTLLETINEARLIAKQLAADGNSTARKKIEILDQTERDLRERSQDRDIQEKVKNTLQETFIELDKQQESGEWPKAEQELREALEDLIKVNKRYGNHNSNRIVVEFENHAQRIIEHRDAKSAQKLKKEIYSLSIELESQDIGFWVGLIQYMDEEFDDITWTDRQTAYQGVQNLKRLLNANPSKERLEQATLEVWGLMVYTSDGSAPSINNSLLRR